MPTTHWLVVTPHDRPARVVAAAGTLTGDGARGVSRDVLRTHGIRLLESRQVSGLLPTGAVR